MAKPTEPMERAYKCDRGHCFALHGPWLPENAPKPETCPVPLDDGLPCGCSVVRAILPFSSCYPAVRR